MAALRNVKQPWWFVVYAVAFGVGTYLIQAETVWTAAVVGVIFGLLMSVWRELRLRRAQRS